MKHNRLADIIGTIVLAAGMLVAFSSHAFHGEIGLSEDTPHELHVLYGMIAAVIGLGILIYNNKALKIWNKKI